MMLPSLRRSANSASLVPHFSFLGGAGGAGDTHFSSISAPITNFSKMYDTAPNPNEGFIAVMTCSDADINCPAIFGCIARIPIPYEDPKISDGTKHEISSYDERCRQISRELLYVFSRID
mgnify:CR=1 FL=1